MDKRIKDISARLREYSIGNFDNMLALSAKLDEVDAISNSINMLGEELKAITISKNYFNNIFNSVSDLVFILDTKGIIQDVNTSAEFLLKYPKGTLAGKSFDSLQKGPVSCFKNILRQLKKPASPFTINDILHTNEGGIMQVSIKASYFKKESHKQLILLTVSDISFEVKAENLIIRAIIDTEEKERNRLAKDLHDGLAQQIAGIKFYISTASILAKNKKQAVLLKKSSGALGEVIGDIRNICFNLMPVTLEEFGLMEGIKEFCNNFLYSRIDFTIKQNKALPTLSAELAIDLYRVMQEFITNATKHGKATKIGIFFNYSKNVLKMKLTDNGIGFNEKKIIKGMGLQNARSRVKSHNGDLTIESSPITGTCYKIIIPIHP